MTDDTSVESLASDPELLLKRYKMPFGRFKGSLLIDLPEPYVIWFASEGFPEGELGKLLVHQPVYNVGISWFVSVYG